MQAMNLNHGYKSETSLIFGGDHNNAMQPSPKEQAEELAEAKKMISRPSESQVLEKYQTKPIHSMNNKKADRSRQKSQQQVREWTENASKIRKQMKSQDN